VAVAAYLLLVPVVLVAVVRAEATTRPELTEQQTLAAVVAVVVPMTALSVLVETVAQVLLLSSILTP
jgi:hypothetical protein